MLHTIKKAKIKKIILMLFKQKALKEVKQLVLFLSERNLKLSGFVLILNKAKF